MKKEIYKIIKVAEFECMYASSINNIAIALASAGRFIKIIKNEKGRDCVQIYEWVK